MLLAYCLLSVILVLVHTIKKSDAANIQTTAIEDEDEYSYGDYSEVLENVFSNEVVEKLWSMDFNS